MAIQPGSLPPQRQMVNLNLQQLHPGVCVAGCLWQRCWFDDFQEQKPRCLIVAVWQLTLTKPEWFMMICYIQTYISYFTHTDLQDCFLFNSKYENHVPFKILEFHGPSLTNKRRAGCLISTLPILRERLQIAKFTCLLVVFTSSKNMGWTQQ